MHLDLCATAYGKATRPTINTSQPKYAALVRRDWPWYPKQHTSIPRHGNPDIDDIPLNKALYPETRNNKLYAHETPANTEVIPAKSLTSAKIREKKLKKNALNLQILTPTCKYNEDKRCTEYK